MPRRASSVPSNGSIQATGTIFNHSSKTSDYDVTLNFVDSGGTVVGNADAEASDVAPGESTQFTATGPTDGSGTGSITCKVVTTIRRASLG